jgi:hypothetical protein
MIQFSLLGVEQPRISILINTDVVYEGIVDGLAYIDIPVELKDNDVITLVGIGKRNGEDGVWDTKVDFSGNIISDKYLIINNITIDYIAMGSEWISSINSLGNFESTSIYKNGELSFVVHEPVLDWIIEEKFIKPEQKELSNRADSYSGAGKFDYNYIRNKINAIKQLLDD